MRSNVRLIQQGRSAHQSNEPTIDANAEQRWANRRAGRTPAILVIDTDVMGSRAAPLTCVLKDTSSTGAKIELSPALAQRWGSATSGLPERFRLQIPSQLVELDCAVAWCAHNYLGVHFTAPPRQLARTQRRAGTVKKKSKLSLLNLFNK